MIIGERHYTNRRSLELFGKMNSVFGSESVRRLFRATHSSRFSLVPQLVEPSFFEAWTKRYSLPGLPDIRNWTNVDIGVAQTTQLLARKGFDARR